MDLGWLKATLLLLLRLLIFLGDGEGRIYDDGDDDEDDDDDGEGDCYTDSGNDDEHLDDDGDPDVDGLCTIAAVTRKYHDGLCCNNVPMAVLPRTALTASNSMRQIHWMNSRAFAVPGLAE